MSINLHYYRNPSNPHLPQASRLSSAAGSRRASINEEPATQASASSGVSSGGSSGDEAPPPPPPPPAPPAPPPAVLEEPAIRPSELRGRRGKWGLRMEFVCLSFFCFFKCVNRNRSSEEVERWKDHEDSKNLQMSCKKDVRHLFDSLLNQFSSRYHTYKTLMVGGIFFFFF